MQALKTCTKISWPIAMNIFVGQQIVPINFIEKNNSKSFKFANDTFLERKEIAT